MSKREIISKNILTLRRKNKLTQAELADKLNYSDKAISKWERGESLPDAEMLYNIAELFNVDISYLFEEHVDAETQAEKDEELKKMEKRELHAKIIFAAVLVTIIFTIFGVVVFNTLSALHIGVPALFVYYIISSIPTLLLIFEIVTGMRFLFSTLFSVTMWSWVNSAFLILSMGSEKPSEFVWIYAIAIVVQISIIIYPRLIKGINSPKKKEK